MVKISRERKTVHNVRGGHCLPKRDGFFAYPSPIEKLGATGGTLGLRRKGCQGPLPVIEGNSRKLPLVSKRGKGMSQRSRLKITVMRKMDAREVFGNQLSEIVNEGHHTCRRTMVGQEFIVQEDGLIPPGFCSYAWHDISPQVAALQFGAHYPSMKRTGEYYCTCHDGVHPVFYKLEVLPKSHRSVMNGSPLNKGRMNGRSTVCIGGPDCRSRESKRKKSIKRRTQR